MATFATPGRDFTSVATEAIACGNGSSAVVSTVVVYLTNATGTSSVTVKARPRGQSAVTPFEIPYRQRVVAGTVMDDTVTDGALAVGNNVTLIEVNTAGLDLVLDHTYTSGTLRGCLDPLEG